MGPHIIRFLKAIHMRKAYYEQSRDNSLRDLKNFLIGPVEVQLGYRDIPDPFPSRFRQPDGEEDGDEDSSNQSSTDPIDQYV